MKKILTLLMAVGTVASLHAQTREETRRIILGEPNNNGIYKDGEVVANRNETGRYPGAYPDNRRNEADQINREYENKIRSIRNNGYLSRAEKEKMIRQLQRDRQQRLKALGHRYNDRNRRYDDDDRYTKNNNGKHKGWNKSSKNKNWKKGNRDRF